MTPPLFADHPLLAAPAGPPPRQRPAEALAALAALLRQRGMTHLYGASGRLVGVLSVSCGVTVWSNGRVLWWRAGDDDTVWPAADAPGACRLITELAQLPEAGYREGS